MRNNFSWMICAAIPWMGMIHRVFAQTVCPLQWASEAFAPAKLNGTVEALVVFDDGTGPSLYAGGSFTAYGASTVDRIARWSGTTWLPVGTGVSGGTALPSVHTLSVADTG